MKRRNILALCLAAFALLPSLFLTSCSGERKEFNTVEDFNGATLGIVTGSIYDGYCRELYPDSSLKYHKNFADVLQALKQGKVDGCMLDEPNYNAVRRTEPTLDCIDVPQHDVEIGYAFQKTADGMIYQAQMNELLAELRTNGELDRLIEKWYGEKEPTEELEIPDFSDNPKTLKVAVDSTRKPFVYLRNGEKVGFEIEVFYMFCERYGYRPDYDDISFAQGIAGLNEGKYDLVSGGIYMTDERKLSVNFSEPYMYADVVMVKLAGELEEDLFAGIVSGFKKTFIDEGRWRLITEGIGTTLLITVASAFFGTLLGFGIYLLCRAIGKVARAITKVFTVITNGTPIVVILMILYYVVFGKTDISGILVSILGFSLTTAAFVYEKMTVSVNSIDVGQTEGALAMGFSPSGLFFNIIFPQAMRFFLPLYKAEMGALVKATSIVGYIAVQDLTQMSDIIRSNTFEAFFPLISSALIYLALSFGISELVQILISKTEPKSRKKNRILKGVDAK